PTGPTGISTTANSMYAGNTIGSAITVVSGGTNIPLPNNQVLDSFVVTITNDSFTVPVTGLYYITYQINIALPLLVGSRIVLNGSAIPGSIFAPPVTTSNFSNDVIVQLTAGDILSLQLFGSAGTATLIGGSSEGAELTIIRLT
ncbi:BclA C-terminal domain-containing protein, partial [Bacillus thuringiensis]|uniref:BclA C-terminal domain-containing protein n=1 Tax=Bacillus thuringiensis TaxID=1428 RepID=UPI000C0319E1